MCFENGQNCGIIDSMVSMPRFVWCRTGESRKKEAYVKRQKDNFIKYAGLVTLDSLWKNFSPAAIYNINSRKILLRKILKEKGVEFIDEHKCLTQFSISYIGHPNKRDMEKSNEWVEKMINALDNK